MPARKRICFFGIPIIGLSQWRFPFFLLPDMCASVCREDRERVETRGERRLTLPIASIARSKNMNIPNVKKRPPGLQEAFVSFL